MRYVPIIPCYNPPADVVSVVNNLLKSGFNNLIIVDDGSSDKTYFEDIMNIEGCYIINHDINMGKGAAIKTGLTFYKNNLINNYDGVICIDCDGQHTVKDSIKVGNKMIKTKKFVIGVRNFNDKSIPFRSRFGNKITSKLFKMLFGVYISDTQTGLRAFPNKLIDVAINCEGDRYEYEINMLIDMVKKDKNIEEESISTIYIDNNKNSKFNPIHDSYLIYKEMFKRK